MLNVSVNSFLYKNSFAKVGLFILDVGVIMHIFMFDIEVIWLSLYPPLS